MSHDPTDLGRPTLAVIDLSACERNCQRIREHIDGRHVWAVVKDDAYGHGAVPVARALDHAGAFGFGVATVREGVDLRQAGITRPILVMTGVEPLQGDRGEVLTAALAEHDISVAVWDQATVDRIAAVVRARRLPEVRVHIKVDTGMGRLGVSLEETPRLASATSRAQGVRFEGIFSNLAAADSPVPSAGSEHTGLQIERFAELCRRLDADGNLPAHRHLANSAGLMHHSDSWAAAWCNGCRPGLALYGVSLAPDRDALGLEPVLALWTAVAAVRDVPAGWPIGYGLRHVTERASRIAVLPVGYHDGWPRALGNRAQVLVAGQRAPLVGAVSMDLTVVDVTDVPAVEVGDPVALIGEWQHLSRRVFMRELMYRPEARDPAIRGAGSANARVLAEEVSDWADSIAHELLCRIGSRVPRVYYESAGPNRSAADGDAQNRGDEPDPEPQP